MDDVIILGSRKEWTWLVHAQVLPHFAFTALFPSINSNKKPQTQREKMCRWQESFSIRDDWNAGRCAAVILLLGRQDGENWSSFFPWLNFSANNYRDITKEIRVSVFMVKRKFVDCVWLNVATFLLFPFMWKQETDLPHNDLHFQNISNSMYHQYL